MTTKELAFEYLMDCFIDWYKSIKNDNSFHYSFTKLKVIKLLFFASAVNANYGQTNEKYKEDSRKSSTAYRKPITYSRASNFGSKNEM